MQSQIPLIILVLYILYQFTGISMGGLGSYMLASRNPTLFSSIMPICGGGSKVFAKLLRDVPAWFAHSEDDNVVAVADTDLLVEELSRVGNNRVR
jgi:predicted peptidase